MSERDQNPEVEKPIDTNAAPTTLQDILPSGCEHQITLSQTNYS